jgi:hypothetical protein
VLAAAVITSPQLTAWFGDSQGALADKPLLESLPPPDAGARKNVVAHAGDVSSVNKMVSANFFMLIAKDPRLVVKIQCNVAHHDSTLKSCRNLKILADGTGRGQVPFHNFVSKQLLPIPDKKYDRHSLAAIS